MEYITDVLEMLLELELSILRVLLNQLALLDVLIVRATSALKAFKATLKRTELQLICGTSPLE